jgi:hypothetical protein
MNERDEAGLLISWIISIIERWIKYRLGELSSPQIWMVEKEVWKIVRESSKIGEEKYPSIGRFLSNYNNHPLSKLIVEENIRREIELESRDSKTYLGPFYFLNNQEIMDFLEWKANKHLGEIGQIDQLISLWRKETRRSLPIIKNEEKEISTNNRGLSIPREGVDPTGSNSETGFKGRVKTQIKGENKAYGPRGKR